MLERLAEFLILNVQNWGWLCPLAVSGYFLYRLALPFVRPRAGRGRRLLLAGTLGVSSGMVIWVGDPNLLYTLPVYFTLFLLCTEGDWMGRLAVCTIFFCLEMSVCAILDTYLGAFYRYEVLARLARPAIFGGLWLALRRRLPREPVTLSRRLWKLALGLAAMPLCALTAVVLVTYDKYDSSSVYSLSMNLGLAVLPFVLLTSLVLLSAVLTLADHERLEQADRLASLRESYYQGLRREEKQVRQLRHDLRNHLTALRGLLDRGDAEKAVQYIDQLSDSAALQGGRRLCENDAANAVLSAKAEAMERAGLKAELAVSLPKNLPVADMDLCALLGNALDNAIEAAERAADKTVTLRCRAEKGLFMLRLENACAGDVPPGLSTSKADKRSHGFGLPGMREIAARYGGSLETRTEDGRFQLVVCLPLSQNPPPVHAGPGSGKD